MTQEPKTISTRYRVIYGDTDCMQIMYYANYLRLFEMGRNEYIRAQGVTYLEIEARGFRLPVTEAGVRFLEPAVYDDEIEIKTTVEKLGRVSVRFGYKLGRVSDQAALVEGFTVHACLDADTGKVTRIAQDILAVL